MATWITYTIIGNDQTRTVYLNLDVMREIRHLQYADAEDNEIHIAYDIEAKQLLVIPKRAQPELYTRILDYLAGHSTPTPTHTAG